MKVKKRKIKKRTILLLTDIYLVLLTLHFEGERGIFWLKIEGCTNIKCVLLFQKCCIVPASFLKAFYIDFTSKCS